MRWQTARLARRSRTRALGAGILALAFVLLALAAAVGPGQADEPAGRTVSVSGRGEVTAVPDLAVVRAAVVTQAATATAALDTNSAIMRDIFAGLANLGVAAGDLRTTALALTPLFDREQRKTPGPPRIVGYQAINRVTVTSRRIGRVGEMLDRLTRLGANRIDGIQFLVKDAESLLDGAREAAVADARRKAALYAGAAGARLGPVLSIREDGARPPPVFQMRAELVQAVPIAPGAEVLAASVNVTFGLE